MADFTKDVQYIRKMVQNGMYDVSHHANERMNERKMNFEEVENILLNEKVKLAKEQGKGKRYEFFTNTNDKIIVALGEQMMIPVIVTVIKGGI